MSNWTELNVKHWDERVAPHAASEQYGLERFRADPTFLSHVVRFDRPRLGDITGLRAVHLQCHIGTDTVSLHRLGAQVTGLDFSLPAIEQARSFAAELNADVEFVRAEFYDAPEVLPNAAFDLVYTGIGALCWLPYIRRWAQVVARLLKPGGRLFMREGHPMLWAIVDPRADGLLVVDYPYFERPEPNVYDEPGSYVDTEHEFINTTSAEWNHGLGEIVSALLDVGMTLTMLVEHDSVPWDALPGMMEQLPDGEYRLVERPWRLPHSYTLRAVKSAG